VSEDLGADKVEGNFYMSSTTHGSLSIHRRAAVVSHDSMCCALHQEQFLDFVLRDEDCDRS
jgi:hypothetical protein